MNVSPTQSGTVKVSETVLTSNPGTATVSGGQSVVLEAMPASGYEFSDWSGDLTGQDNPATLVPTCNKTITASFSQITHILTMEVQGAGSVTPSIGSHSYAEGTLVDIGATPETGYRFDSWTGVVGNANSASTTVIVGSDKTVTANFSQIKTTSVSWHSGWFSWIMAGLVVAIVLVVVKTVRRRPN